MVGDRAALHRRRSRPVHVDTSGLSRPILGFRRPAAPRWPDRRPARPAPGVPGGARRSSRFASLLGEAGGLRPAADRRPLRRGLSAAFTAPARPVDHHHDVPGGTPLRNRAPVDLHHLRRRQFTPWAWSSPACFHEPSWRFTMLLPRARRAARLLVGMKLPPRNARTRPRRLRHPGAVPRHRLDAAAGRGFPVVRRPRPAGPRPDADKKKKRHGSRHAGGLRARRAAQLRPADPARSCAPGHRSGPSWAR